jgi:hypothetical protein
MRPIRSEKPPESRKPPVDEAGKACAYLSVV